MERNRLLIPGPVSALRKLVQSVTQLFLSLPGLDDAHLSLQLFDANLGWRSPVNEPPAAADAAPSLQVLGVIYDPNFYDPEPFVDIVTYWPADKRWTVTHSSRADKAAGDHDVRVIGWKPLDDIPPPWSDLWD
jgi:hypothetical protein